MILLKLFGIYLMLIMHLKATESAHRLRSKTSFLKRLQYDLVLPDTGEYGKPVPMIIVSASLAKVPFATRVYSAHYMIMNFWAPVEKGHTWKRSRNITSEILKLGLEPPNNLLFDRGYYFSRNAVFYEYGNIDITAEVAVVSKVGLSETDRKRIKKKVTIKMEEDCWPLIQISDCGNALKPIPAQLTQHFNVKGNVMEDCLKSIKRVKYVFKWRIYDQVGQMFLKSLSDTTLPIHFIKSHELKFNYSDDATARQIMILLSTRIEGKEVGARCYLHIVSGRVKAIIDGSDIRYVNYYKAITFNGSRSYNTDTKPGTPHELNYNWDCESLQDLHNENCQKSISASPSFTLEPNSLTNDKRYQFTLTVSASDDVSLNAKAVQQVIVVQRNVLSIDIICVLNCRMDVFDPRERVHLRAVCYDCGKQKLFYDWYVDNIRIGQKRTMVISIHPSKSFVTMKLKITTPNGDWSMATKRLSKNKPPDKGTCKIKPKIGYEIKTRFQITCEDFAANFVPLSYFLTVQKVTLSQSFSGSYNIFLPTTRFVEIRICDALFVCTERRLDVLVKPHLKIPTEPVQLRKQLQNKFRISELFNKGDLSAWLILNAVATKVKTAAQAQVILDQFKEHEPTAVLDLGKMANLTRTLIEQLNPINEKKTKVLTKMLRLLNDNFKIVIDNGNIKDLGLYPYVNVTTACVTFLTEFSNVAEALPLPPEEIYGMVKKKKLTAELIRDVEAHIMLMTDPEAIERSLAWVKANWQLERLITYLGLASVENLRPDEDVVRIITESVAFEERCHYVDGITGYVINTADGLHKVHFPIELLRELSEGMGASHICVKVISMFRQLYWWFPVDRQPSARILIVRAFTRGKEFSKEVVLDNQLVFQVALGKYKPAQKHDDTPQKVSVQLEKQFLDDDDVDKDEDEVEDEDEEVRAQEENNDKALAIYENFDDTWQWLVPVGLNLFAYDLLSQPEPQSKRNELTTQSDYIDFQQNLSNAVESRQKRVVEQEKVSVVGDLNSTMVNGTIFYHEETHLYRVNIDAATVLAIRFFHSTHDLRILIKGNEKPKRLEITGATCIVPAGTTNKTILFANKCNMKATAYMGLRVSDRHKVESCKNILTEREPIEDGPCTFSFVFQMRSCDYWVYDKKSPHWTTAGCLPSMDYNIGKGLTCRCEHLSSYTAYVFNMIAVRLPLWTCSYHDMPVNIFLILFHCILWPALIILLLVLWIRQNSAKILAGKSIACTLLRDDGDKRIEPHSFFIIVKTAGSITAGTTANVTLTFQTLSNDELHVTIYQDAEHPKLCSNTTRIFEMTTREVRIPTVLGIYHDNAGRYPSWNVRSVQLVDANTHMRQTFIIDRWITGRDIFIVTGTTTHIGEPLLARSIFVRFTDSMERIFTNYFMFQPLLGNWRVEGSVYQLTRFERVCVWAAKIAVAITVTFIYYGPTTVDNYEEQRDYYVYVTWVHYDDAIIICILSYICVCIVDLFYLFIIIPISHKHVFHIPH